MGVYKLKYSCLLEKQDIIILRYMFRVFAELIEKYKENKVGPNARTEDGLELTFFAPYVIAFRGGCVL